MKFMCTIDHYNRGGTRRSAIWPGQSSPAMVTCLFTACMVLIAQAQIGTIKARLFIEPMHFLNINACEYTTITATAVVRVQPKSQLLPHTKKRILLGLGILFGGRVLNKCERAPGLDYQNQKSQARGSLISLLQIYVVEKLCRGTYQGRSVTK